MIIEDEAEHVNAARYLRLFDVDVTLDAGGGYLVEQGGLEFRLSQRELVAFAHGYCVGRQRAGPEWNGRRIQETT